MADTSRDLLAKLLAEENITIEHRKVSTAFFDPETRILTMPIWKDIDSYTHVMMFAHECGHALYSPLLDAIPEDLNKSYVNVVEDARIDKLIKRKYPGLAKDYYFGYRYLLDNNFFGTAGKDIDSYPFIDRINLYFKGSPLVYFNPEEREIVSKIEQVETFEEVLELVRIITEYIKENPQSKISKFKIKLDGIDSSEYPNLDNAEEIKLDELTETPSFNDSDSEDSDEDEESNNYSTTENESDEAEKEIEGESDNNHLQDSLTDTAWQRNMSMLINDEIKTQVTVSMPKVNYDHYITSWKNSYSELKEYIDRYTSPEYARNIYNHSWFIESYQNAMNGYFSFKKKSLNSVNYLVKEFEMRKSADAYSRSRVSKTGVINTNTLHSYLWNEDIFKKVVNLPEGKNHGLIMFVDWSGSMSDKLVPTVKQLFNLIWFCRKVNIPYDIYTFASNISSNYSYSSDWQDNTIAFDKTFRLIQIFNSQMNNILTENQMRNLWILANNEGDTKYGGLKQVSFGSRYSLGSTPLNETIITSKYVADNFMKKNKVQKLHFIYLTDGEGAPMYINCSELSDRFGSYSRHVPINVGWCRNSKIKAILKDKNNEWNISQHGSHLQAEALLNWLKTYYPQSSTLSIRITNDYDARSLAYSLGHEWDEKEPTRQLWKKEGYFAATNKFGFNRDFIIRFNSRYTADYDTEEMNVDSNATKSVMSRQFVKHLKNRMQSKMMLRSFIETIA